MYPHFPREASLRLCVYVRPFYPMHQGSRNALPLSPGKSHKPRLACEEFPRSKRLTTQKRAIWVAKPIGIDLHCRGVSGRRIGRAPHKTHEDPPKRAFAIIFEFSLGAASRFRGFAHFHALSRSAPPQRHWRLRSVTGAFAAARTPSQQRKRLRKLQALTPLRRT